MSRTVSVIMPACNAEATIVAAVNSVRTQTYPHWALIIVADDGVDYARLLAADGVIDPRISFLDSGGIRRGVAHARNVALDHISTDYAAVLDADDLFRPTKLERSVAALSDFGLVTSALEITDHAHNALRRVASAQQGAFSARDHKWINFSGDSMIAWDRRKADGRYDPSLPNLSDLDFVLQLYRRLDAFWHLGTPLYEYVKFARSLSNGAGVTQRMINSKTTLLERLRRNDYALADPGVAQGFIGFLEISLAAEASYGQALAARPGLLFEDHLEPQLTRAKRG